MAKKYTTGLIITGDSKDGVRAVRATERALESLQRETSKTIARSEALTASFSNMSIAAGAAAAGLGVAVAGTIALAARQADAVQQTNALAQALGTSTSTLQTWQYAATKVGVEADQVGDIFKDVSDKLGEFMATGGGEAAELFEQLPIDVARLRQLKPADQIVAIAEAIGTLDSKAKRTFFAEALADDFSRLLPLLVNGASGLRQAATEARRFGYALDEVETREMLDIAIALDEMRAKGQGLANMLTLAMGPSIMEANSRMDDLADTVQSEDFQRGVSTLSNLFLGLTTNIAESVEELGKFVENVNELDLGGLGKQWLSLVTHGPIMQSLLADEDLSRVEKLKNQVAHIREQLAQPTQIGLSTDQLQAQLAAKLEELRRAKLQSNVLHDIGPQTAVQARTISQGGGSDPGGDSSDSNGAGDDDSGLSDKITAAERLRDKYRDLTASYEKQIALFGKTSDASELRYRLEFGDLTQLTDARQQNLLGMAKELALLKEEKQTIQALFPAWQRLEHAQQLRDSVSGLPPEMQEFGRRRANHMISDAATQGMPGMSGLDPMYNGAFGEANRLQREQAQYDKKYQERLNSCPTINGHF